VRFVFDGFQKGMGISRAMLLEHRRHTFAR
jgi:hypothetical protein